MTVETLRRQKVLYDDTNATNPLRFSLIVRGTVVTPSSATVTIYKPGSTTAVVATTACTISGSVATYAVNTTTTADFPLNTGYRAEVAFTVGTDVYESAFIFDVVRFLLRLGVGVDQLLARDDSLRGLEHNGDEDFSDLIEACRDEVQLIIESKVIDAGGVLENMVIDSSRLAVPFRLYVLAAILLEKGRPDDAKRYEEKFDAMLPAVLQTVKYDVDQDGQEDASARPSGTRFVF